MTDRSVEVVAFDVNETLVDMTGLRPAFASIGLAPDLVALWFARVLRDGFALTALGEYQPFAAVAAQALRGLGPDLVNDAAVDVVQAAFRRLDPHPDVGPALDLLRQAGVTVVTLTNGSSDLAAALLRRAGLDGHVTANLSVDDVRRWKPAPEPYRYAANPVSDPTGSRWWPATPGTVPAPPAPVCVPDGWPAASHAGQTPSRHPTSPDRTCPASSGRS